MEAKRVPLLENLVKNIACLAITLVAAGRLLAAIVGSPQKPSSAVAPQRFSQPCRAATVVEISFSKSHCLTNYKAITLIDPFSPFCFYPGGGVSETISFPSPVKRDRS